MIKDKFVKINNWLREIPKTYREDMQVPARIYVSDKLWEQIEDDESQNKGTLGPTIQA